MSITDDKTLSHTTNLNKVISLMPNIDETTQVFRSNILKSVLFLALAISGNFIGSTLPCQVQWAMTNKPVVKHAIILCIIYFTLNFTSKVTELPHMQIITVVIIWIFYILFSKSDARFSLITFALTTIAYIINSYIEYYKNEKNINENLVKQLEVFKTFAFYSIFISTIIGFVVYFIKTRCDYGKQFNFMKFIFGVTTCASLK